MQAWLRELFDALRGLLITVLYRVWMWTLRVKADPIPRRKAIVVLWHETFFPVIATYRRWRVTALASQHRDGRLAARILRTFGYRVVFGSSTRGGKPALDALTRVLTQDGVVAITPDGPRGPRRVLKPGALALWRRTGAPLYLLGVAAQPARRLKSWDQFLVPLPFARCRIRVEGPYPLGEQTTLEEVALALDEVNRRAEEDLDASIRL